MKENLLEHTTPLYGRKTAQIKLKPIKFIYLQNFYQTFNLEDLVKAYAFSGGIPQYAKLVNFPFEKWFEKEVIREDSFLADEVEFLIKSEFKKEKSYFSILEAISKGKNTFSEIKEHGRFKETDITPYLANLKYVELLDAENALLESKRRNSRYTLKDNFISFWFNFVYPYLFEIDIRKYKLDKTQFNAYLGRIFKEVIIKLFSEELFIKAIGVHSDSFGRQWGRIPHDLNPEKGKNQYEIDVVGLNDRDQTILFAECKWQEEANAFSIAKELNTKTGFVNWKNSSRKEILLIFAKSFSKRTNEFEGKVVKCFDLKDIEKIILKN